MNSEWFDIQADENPTGLEIQLKLLSSLGKYRALGRFVARHPETAGLLAAAAEPELIAAGLDTDNENYQVISGLYIQHAAPGEPPALRDGPEESGPRRDANVAF